MVRTNRITTTNDTAVTASPIITTIPSGGNPPDVSDRTAPLPRASKSALASESGVVSL